MNRILLVICAVFGLAMSFADLPEGAVSVLLVLVVSFPILYIIRNYSEEKEFLTNLFLIALLVRLTFGFAAQILEIKMLIAEDSMIYDAVGWRLVEIWQGLPVPNDDITYRAVSFGPGWGMHYLTAAIYYICGQSILAAQSFCAVVGAATAPMIYFCAEKIYNNRRVGKISAIFIALFPSFIIWSSQLLKDGLIIFLLVVAMTMVIQLQKKFNYPVIIILLLSLFGILTLRFYIFYMVAFAVAGSFIIGLSPSVKSIVRNLLVIVFLGVGLTYLGVVRTAETQLDEYANLERIQASRADLATSAKSGFAEDVDVSTTQGALLALPIGFAYLMFAPFPWEVTNFRQAATLPEVFLWWAMIPLLISGLWYTIKNRFRSATSVLIFSLMLTLAYSIFQGNIGTAYRQRTQIQVFLFIFIAVGWTLLKEKSENRKEVKKLNRQKVERRLRDLRQAG